MNRPQSKPRLATASILVFDLIKHTQKDSHQSGNIQAIVRAAFENAQRVLNLNRTNFKHIGDGYVITFLDEDSARVIEFLNATIPTVKAAFDECQQQFRAGVDIGVIRLTEDVLTRQQEFFDLPAVRAARLEASAPENTILCTDTFYELLSPHFADSFENEATTVAAKDRILTAHTIRISDFHKIKSEIANLLIKADANEKCMDRKILVLDDEELLAATITMTLRTISDEVVQCTDSRLAVEMVRNSTFDVVFTDLVMPGVSGWEFIAEVRKASPNTFIVVVSGVSFDDQPNWFDADPEAHIFVKKPFNIKVLLDCVRNSYPGSLYNMLYALHLRGSVCELFSYLLETKNTLLHLMGALERNNSSAGRLLRHKTLGLRVAFIESLHVSADVLESTQRFKGQLDSLYGLYQNFKGIGKSSFQSFLRQYITDLEIVNPQIKFTYHEEFAYDIPEALISLLALVTCELIDNAVAAVVSGNIRVDVSYLSSKEQLCVVVHDSGPGVKKELEASIFQEGVSTKGIGRGLGLALIKSACQQCGGNVVYSYLNGSRFSVILPIRM